jgi:hypothetical protein
VASESDKTGRYVPVDVKAIQWAKVLKVIDAEGASGIPVYDLAEQFDVPPSSPELEKTVDLLLKQGKVRVSMGFNDSAMPCRIIQAVRN